jgi:hypothetical protein
MSRPSGAAKTVKRTPSIVVRCVAPNPAHATAAADKVSRIRLSHALTGSGGTGYAFLSPGPAGRTLLLGLRLTTSSPSAAIRIDSTASKIMCTDMPPIERAGPGPART